MSFYSNPIYMVNDQMFFYYLWFVDLMKYLVHDFIMEIFSCQFVK